jgi:hypothetical protein
MLNGFTVTLYAYDQVQNVPDGIKFADADEIVGRGLLEQFKVMGRPSIPHFADYFRCCLFKGTGQTWIDADILCLRPFFIDEQRSLLAMQSRGVIGNAILRVDPKDRMLTRLIAGIEEKADGRDHPYGASGPSLITDVYGRSGIEVAYDPKYFFPIPWEKWWMPFLPSERAACEETCANANVIHLWNNLIDAAGIWKDMLPPVGSFIHGQLTRFGMEGMFEGTYPESVIRAIVNNYEHLQTGDHMPLKKLAHITARRTLSYFSSRFRSDGSSRTTKAP